MLDGEHSFIVTVMKPVVYVPWYQVLPWTLSGGDLPLSAPAGTVSYLHMHRHVNRTATFRSPLAYVRHRS